MSMHLTTDCAFPGIKPINAVREGIALGSYTHCYAPGLEQYVRFSPAYGEKELHVICFNRSLATTDYVRFLHAIGKRPCQNAPAYLLGLMAQVAEDRMPLELCNMKIVAASPDAIFETLLSYRCSRACNRGSLCVSRFNGSRELELLAHIDGEYTGCAFVTENL